MPIRKLLRILGVVVGVIAVMGAALMAYAFHASERTLDVPLPNIGADRSAEGVARGAGIFHATCEGCHVPPGGDRATGAPIKDAPAWLGELHSGNVTADPRGGIGAISDAVAARMIRYGVNRAGHWAPMPSYAMSDRDLAAVLGFLRSNDPLFRPEPQPAPRSRLSAAGRAALLLGGVFTPPARPAHIEAPARAPSLEYGRYLAEGLYQCGDCHTPGFDSDKVRGPDAYAGGAELKDAGGAPVLSPNLTRDESAGLGRWNREQFALAVRSGIRPDGAALGYPMPHFRAADDLEIDALWVYLRSLPPRPEVVAGRRPAVGRAARPPVEAFVPSRAFEQLGCSGCHGKGALYESRLSQASGKPPLEVARWIRNPEAFRPGTPMPTFAAVLDEPSALELAMWVQRRSEGPHAVSLP